MFLGLVAPAILITALGLGAGLALARRRNQPTGPVAAYAPGKTPRFAGQLEHGESYRVWAHVRKAYADAFAEGAEPGHAQEQIEAGLSRNLEPSGFSVRLAVQDPTDPERWSFLATYEGASREPTYDPSDSIQLEEATLVEPLDDVADGSEEQTEVSNMDPGLSVDELHALKFAIERDHDPRRLEGFARTFDGEMPIAASLLHAKSRLEDLARTKNAPAPTPDLAATFGRLTYARMRMHGAPEGEATAREAARLAALGLAKLRAPGTPWQTGSPWDLPVLSTIEDIGTSAIDALKSVSDDLGLSDAWDKFGGIVEVIAIPGRIIWLAETGVKLADAIDKGENVGHVLTGQALRFLEAAKKLSPFLRLVPGLGSGVAVMLDSALSIAIYATVCADTGECPPLDEATVTTLSSALLNQLPFDLPSGVKSIAEEGYQLGMKAGFALARGEPLDEVAAEAIRDRLGPEAQILFDGGLALARGKSLADAGFANLAHYALGSDLVTKGEEFASSALEAARRNIPIKSVLIEELGRVAGNIPADIREPQFADAVAWLTEDPERLKNFPNAVAEELGIDPVIANAALAAVQDHGDGITTLDPQVSIAIMTKGLRNLRPVPKSALTSAYAQIRPQFSMIESPPAMVQRLTLVRNLSQMGDPLGEEAQRQLERAQKLLDRRNWVAWYKRLEAAGSLP